jgi:hypothetical protein
MKKKQKPHLTLAAAAALGLSSMRKLPAQKQASPQRPGYIDPQKLMDAGERLQKMIERENAAREERIKELEKTRAALKKATDDMIEAVEAPKRAQEQQAADWRQQGCPVIEAVTVRRPLKLKAPGGPAR